MFGEIRNKHGERLDYTLHEGPKGSKDIVVLGHGVTGNKDRPFLVALAEGFAEAGLSALRFSFSGNGASEGKFTASTISKEVEDLGAVLDRLDGHRICYVGHSMGGAVGVLRASSDSRIKLLVSLAGMVHTKAFAQREFDDVTPAPLPGGVAEAGFGFMWDEPSCPLSKTYMDDMAKIDTVVNHGSQITVPWLLVHGTEDDVVPIQDSKDILAKTADNAAFIEITGADHVFSGASTPVMVEIVVSWVQDGFTNLNDD